MINEFSVKADEVTVTVKCQRKTNVTLKEYIITKNFGERSEDVDMTTSQHIKVIFYEIFAAFLSKIDLRFTKNNKLYDAISTAENETDIAKSPNN